MNKQIIDIVFPVFEYAITQLEASAPTATGHARQIALNHLASLVNKSLIIDREWYSRGHIPDTNSGLHYLLSSWVDEIFIAHSPWSEEWKENRITSCFPQYSRSDLNNVRARRVPDLAIAALKASKHEIVELYLLVFSFGFEGIWPEETNRSHWLQQAALDLEQSVQRTGHIFQTSKVVANYEYDWGQVPEVPVPLASKGSELELQRLALRFALCWLLSGLVLVAAVLIREAMAFGGATYVMPMMFLEGNK